MSIIFDPEFPDVAIIENAAVGEFGVQMKNVVIERVHSAELCEGRPCVIHHPSDHHMRGWPLNFRGDKGQMERLCPHGVGHPDLDDLNYHVSQGRAWMGVHGCDGCCGGWVPDDAGD